MNDSKYGNTITVWRKILSNDVYGTPTWDNPFTLQCRIEDKQRTYITEQGRTERGQSVVYTKGDDLVVGDYITEGDSTENTQPVSGAYDVKNRRKTPSLRNTRVEYRFIL